MAGGATDLGRWRLYEHQFDLGYKPRRQLPVDSAPLLDLHQQRLSRQPSSILSPSLLREGMDRASSRASLWETGTLVIDENCWAMGGIRSPSRRSASAISLSTSPSSTMRSTARSRVDNRFQTESMSYGQNVDGSPPQLLPFTSSQRVLRLPLMHQAQKLGDGGY